MFSVLTEITTSAAPPRETLAAPAPAAPFREHLAASSPPAGARRQESDAGADDASESAETASPALASAQEGVDQDVDPNEGATTKTLNAAPDATSPSREDEADEPSDRDATEAAELAIVVAQIEPTPEAKPIHLDGEAAAAIEQAIAPAGDRAAIEPSATDAEGAAAPDGKGAAAPARQAPASVDATLEPPPASSESDPTPATKNAQSAEPAPPRAAKPTPTVAPATSETVAPPEASSAPAVGATAASASAPAAERKEVPRQATSPTAVRASSTIEPQTATAAAPVAQTANGVPESPAKDGSVKPRAEKREAAQAAPRTPAATLGQEEAQPPLDTSARVDGASTDRSSAAPTHDGKLGDVGPAQHAEAPVSSGVNDLERTRLVQRVARAIQHVDGEGGTVRIRLSPPELGSLRIELSVHGGVMAARLEADNPLTRSLLLENLPALRERLAEQQIRVERFDVDLSQRDSGGNGQAWAEQQRAAPWLRSPARGARRGAGAARVDEAAAAPRQRLTAGRFNVVV